MANDRSNKPAGGRTQSFLATQFAAVSAGGWQQTLTAVRGVADNLALATRVALGWDKVQRTITINAAALAKAFANIGPGLAAGLLAPLRQLQSMASGVAANTVEGDRLALSMTRLQQTLAAELGPWIRLLTAGVQELTGWWKGLDSGTKQIIATVVALTAAFAAMVALLPAITAAVGALTAGFIALVGVVSAPWVAIPLLIAAAAAAVTAFFGMTTDNSKEAADVMGEHADSWVATLLRGIEFLGAQFIKFFNFIRKQQGKLADWLVERMIEWDTIVGNQTIEQERRLKELNRQMGDIQMSELSLEEWKATMNKARGIAAKALDIKDIMGAGLKDLFGLLDRVGKGKPLQVKFDVKFESLQGTFDRLQQAFAAGAADNLEQEQVNVLKEGVELLKKMAGNVQEVATAIPAVK